MFLKSSNEQMRDSVVCSSVNFEPPPGSLAYSSTSPIGFLPKQDPPSDLEVRPKMFQAKSGSRHDTAGMRPKFLG